MTVSYWDNDIDDEDLKQKGIVSTCFLQDRLVLDFNNGEPYIKITNNYYKKDTLRFVSTFKDKRQDYLDKLLLKKKIKPKS